MGIPAVGIFFASANTRSGAVFYQHVLDNTGAVFYVSSGGAAGNLAILGYIDSVHATLFTPPTQDSGLIIREFMTAFRQVSRGSRQALLLSTLGGQSHERIASHTGVAVGTVKSHISRGRAALQRLLAGKAMVDACSSGVGTALMSNR